MRIILASGPKYLAGPQSGKFSEELTGRLVACGHQVEYFKLPLRHEPTCLVEQIFAIRLLDIDASADLVIAMSAPAHLLRHTNKCIWFAPECVLLSSLVDNDTSVRGPGAALLNAIRIHVQEADWLGIAEARRNLSGQRIDAQSMEKVFSRGLQVTALECEGQSVTGFQYPRAIVQLHRSMTFSRKIV